MDSKKGKAKDKEKEKSKEKVKESKEKITDIASKIDETDEMKLKMIAAAALDAPDPDDILYPPELNAHLIEQLKVMTGENNGLRKTVFEKDESIRELNKTIAELNQRIRDIISGTGPTISSKSAGIISQKITNLCRQNRHLISELEHYKSKNGSLERKIMQLELLTKEQEKFEPCLCKEELVDASSDELKELNLKLASVNKKLYDSKNKNLELKNEILLATKILQQELGDRFTSIKELQNDVVGWKGRAQQISLLQAKIAELEEKLNIAKRDKDNKKDYTNQGQAIKDIEAKKKKETEQAMKEFETLKSENQELKKKLDAAKCRIRNLECDVTTIRQKMQTFAEKSKHDDMLINEQRNEIKTIELYYQDVLKENTSKINKMNADIAEHQKSTKCTESKIDALRKQADEKTAKIDELRAQLLRYEECSLQSVFFTPMKTATDNEIKKLSELVVKLNERIDTERHKWEELETSNRKLKERKRRLEKKIIALEEELKALQQDTKRGSRTSKTSLPSYDFGGTSTPAMKKKPSITAVTEKVSESTSSESYPEINENLDKEELKFKLELTEEKLKIMEDKLKMIEEEKLEDYNHLTEMIQTSKQLFNEALAVLQKERCICPTCPA